MIEALITPAALDGVPENSVLRPLSWPEVVARLAAANEFRRAFGTGRGPLSAAFSSFATANCGPDEMAQGASVNEPGAIINLDTLADGKGRGPITSFPALDAAHGDREI